MNIAELLGQNISPEFVRACERAQAQKDYPSFDMAYQHSEAYTAAYIACYHADIDAREAEIKDDPIVAYKAWRDREDMR